MRRGPLSLSLILPSSEWNSLLFISLIPFLLLNETLLSISLMPCLLRNGTLFSRYAFIWNQRVVKRQISQFTSSINVSHSQSHSLNRRSTLFTLDNVEIEGLQE